MSNDSVTTPTPKWMYWMGWVLSLLPILPMLMGAMMSFHMTPEAAKNMESMGWKPETAMVIGILSSVSIVLYLIPQTAVLGAIMLTGYLGGAVATHLRVGENGMAWVPVLFGVVLWLGLYLRDVRLRALVPVRSV